MKQPLTPASLAPPFGQYSHGMKAAAQGVLVTSGQLGVAPDGSVPEDAGEQARICFESIAAILREGGLSMAHVVRLNAFVTDRKYMPAYMKARDEALADCAVKPASTLVIIAGLSRPEFVVEVEATAVY